MKTQKLPKTAIDTKATTTACSERLPKKRKLPLLLTFAVMLVAASPAQATIVINGAEVGGDVVFSLSGNVNLDSLTFSYTGWWVSDAILPSLGEIAFGPDYFPPSGYAMLYLLPNPSGPADFGTGWVSWPPSSTGELQFLFESTDDFIEGPGIILPNDYVSLAPLSTYMTFTSTDFATLGVTPGTYIWTWGPAGGPSDSLILNIGNAAPTANAGLDQSIHAGTTVNLDGSLSFDDNTATTALQYSWTLTEKPVGSGATLTNADTATPSFVADLDGDYVVQLVVTDEGALASAPDEVLISSFNQAPTAQATATTMLPLVGAAVSLDGSTSTDPDGDALTYAWAVTSRPAGSVAGIVNADASLASFTPDLVGDYEITLTVSDFLGAGTPASVSFVASTAPQFAEEQTIATAGTIAALPSSAVTNSGNQHALENFLSQAVSQLHHGNVASAIDKLNKAIERTDGCVLRIGPDGSASGFTRDWITDCAVQKSVYDSLTAALNALQP